MGNAKHVSRFWQKVQLGLPDECWPWQAALRPNGYGQAYMPEWGVGYAHRFAWEIVNGPIPDGLCVLHHCDNRRCCNTGHLFLGTKADNTHDMMAKGRHGGCNYPRVHGEQSALAKLTDAGVRDIKARYSQHRTTQAVLAAEYGVSPTTVGLVLRGKTWVHVGDSQ